MQTLRKILLILSIDAISCLDAAIYIKVQYRSDFETSEQSFPGRIETVSERNCQAKYFDTREIWFAALWIGSHVNLSVAHFHKTLLVCHAVITPVESNARFEMMAEFFPRMDLDMGDIPHEFP